MDHRYLKSTTILIQRGAQRNLGLSWSTMQYRKGIGSIHLAACRRILLCAQSLAQLLIYRQFDVRLYGRRCAVSDVHRPFSHQKTIPMGLRVNAMQKLNTQALDDKSAA